MKKNIKLWMSFTFIALLVVLFPALFLMSGCNVSEDGTSSSTGGNKGNVTGVVTDATTGNPIENVSVTIVEATEGARATISDQTDADGNYLLQNVNAGDQTITGVISGYANYTDTVTVVAKDTVKKDIAMSLSTGGSITGGVVNGVDGIKVAGATVYVGDVVAISDSDGLYTLNGVATGNQVLRASASSYIAYQKTITVTAGETQTIEIDMAEVTPSTPASGKANIYGRVIDSSENPISGASVQAFSKSREPEARQTTTPTPVATATTDGNGTYTLSDIAPGTYQLTITKSGATSTTSVTATSDENNRATTVTLGVSPTPTATATSTATASPTATSTGTVTTTWVSKQASDSTGQNSKNADVSDDGGKVVFESTGKMLTNDSPAGVSQVYLWTASSGTIIRLSNSTTVATSGGNAASTNPSISGDGKVAIFTSVATDILASGGASPNNGDLFLCNLSSQHLTKVSLKNTNTGVGGDAASDNADLNGDGTIAVFQSLATDLGSTTHTATYSHIYYVAVTNPATDSPTIGTRRMLDISTGLTEGIGDNGAGGAVSPASANPVVSYDGKYTAFQSRANNICAAGNNPVATSTIVHVYRNYIDGAPATGWNIIVSKNGATLGNGNSTLPTINTDGSKVAFQTVSTNLGLGDTDALADIYLYNFNTTALSWVSQPLTGTKGSSTKPSFDKAGKYIVFLSDTIRLVPSVTNAIARPYIKDTTVASNTYTLVSGSSGQVPEAACDNPIMAGTGNHVVFETASKNLTTDSYAGATTLNVFIRKWQ